MYSRLIYYHGTGLRAIKPMMIISILLLQMGYIVERQDCNQREFVIVLRPWGQDFVDVLYRFFWNM